LKTLMSVFRPSQPHRPYSAANERWSCRCPQARRRLWQTTKNATGSTSARARTHQSGAVRQPSRQNLQRPSRNHLSLPRSVRGLVNSLCRFSVPLSRTGQLRRTLSIRRAHLLSFRGGDGQCRGEQTVRQEAADAMDPARRASSLADPHSDARRNAAIDLRALVSATGQR